MSRTATNSGTNLSSWSIADEWTIQNSRNLVPSGKFYFIPQRRGSSQIAREKYSQQFLRNFQVIREESWTPSGYFPKTNINIPALVGLLVGSHPWIPPKKRKTDWGWPLAVQMLPTRIATHCDSVRGEFPSVLFVASGSSALVVRRLVHPLPTPASPNLTASFAATRRTGEGNFCSPYRINFHSRSLSFVTSSPSRAPLFTLPASKFSFTSANPWKFHAPRDEKVEK